MLAILETDELSAESELEQLRIEATRRNDAILLAPLAWQSSSGSMSSDERTGTDHRCGHLAVVFCIKWG